MRVSDCGTIPAYGSVRRNEMDTLSITHVGPVIGILWVLSWAGAIAFVGQRSTDAKTK